MQTDKLIEELQREVERLKKFEYLANVDDLTGILNRRKFAIIMGEEMSKRKETYPLSLIMFDVDHFKKINDTFGHYIGDSVLKVVSEVVSDFIGERGYFARWGGEEFIILFPLFYQEEARRMGEALRNLIATAPLETGQITISLGLTTIREDDSISSTIARADNAVYRAKHNGRNRLEVAE